MIEFLKETFKEAFNIGKKTLKTAVKTTLTLAAPAFVKGVVEKATEFIKGIWANFSEVDGFNEKKATVDEVESVNEVLERCIESYKEESIKNDKDAKEMLEGFYKAINSSLKEINEEFKEILIEDYIFEIFKNEYKHLSKDLDNIYSKEIANGFSLNNSEILEILKLKKEDRLRNIKLSKFTKNLLKKANTKFEKGLTECFKDLRIKVSQNLDEYIKNKEENILLSKRETENILKKIDENKENKLIEEKKYDGIIDEIETIIQVLEVA